MVKIASVDTVYRPRSRFGWMQEIEEMAKARDYAGMTLHELLAELSVHPALAEVLPSLFDACSVISRKLRSAVVSKSGVRNEFGEEQLSVDLMAERQLRDWAKNCSAIKAVSSEEHTPLTEVHAASGSVIVCWDPLDGSSVVDSNWSVASIFGFYVDGFNGIRWNGPNTLIGATGRQQAAALLVVYGSRTTALLAAGGVTVDLHLECGEEGGLPKAFARVSRGPCKLKDGASTFFAPANLRAAADLPAYSGLVQRWIQNKYTLRYSGALGADVYQLVSKGEGVFANPTSAQSKAKLRLAFEVWPLAFIVEFANGKSSQGAHCPLDTALKTMDERSAFCCGSKEEVEKFEEAFAGSSP